MSPWTKHAAVRSFRTYSTLVFVVSYVLVASAQTDREDGKLPDTDPIVQDPREQLDDTWTVTVNGQHVPANSGGGFTIPNISAADEFGIGGPGSAPDFVSDDFLRVIATSSANGTTRYAFSEPFQFRQGDAFVVGEMTITDSPPPFPNSVDFEPIGTTLTQSGQTAQLQLLGKLIDDSTLDVTSRSQWTSYRTSNPDVASIGPDGLVTAGNKTGFVFITGMNEGASAVVRATIALDDPLTTVEGFVQLEDDNTPVVGAVVSIIGFSLETTTDSNGRFEIPNVPTTLGQISVRASNAGLLSSATNLELVPGGITDAGIIKLAAPTSGEALEFLVAFQANNSTIATKTVFISGLEAATGTVEIPGLAFIEQFEVTPGVVTSVVLPSNVSMTGSDELLNRGVFVSASRPITVYGLNQQSATTDAFAAIPVGALGTRHRAMSYAALFQSQVAIVAAEDNTEVIVTPSDATAGRPAGVPFTIQLNRFDVYQLASGGDLTGTLVTSDKPVGVFSGNQCANVPVSARACDHLCEQMPPTNTWGSRVVTVPLATRQNGDTFRILADENNTTVQIVGPNPETFSLGAGEFAERLLIGNNEIIADAPILVAQYSNGTTFDGVTSDPFMMLIPPSAQFLNTYTFATPGSGISANYVNIIAAEDDANNGLVFLDGAPVDSAEFTEVGASGFVCAKLPISVGSHSVTGAKPLGLYVYGFDSSDSYGYPGGFGLLVNDDNRN